MTDNVRLSLQSLLRGLGIILILLSLAGTGYMPSVQRQTGNDSWLRPQVYLLAIGIVLQIGALYIPVKDLRPQHSLLRRIIGWFLIYFAAFAMGTGGTEPGLICMIVGILLIRRRKIPASKEMNEDAAVPHDAPPGHPNVDLREKQ